jgi:hypothetical protein
VAGAPDLAIAAMHSHRFDTGLSRIGVDASADVTDLAPFA